MIVDEQQTYSQYSIHLYRLVNYVCSVYVKHEKLSKSRYPFTLSKLNTKRLHGARILQVYQ